MKEFAIRFRNVKEGIPMNRIRPLLLTVAVCLALTGCAERKEPDAETTECESESSEISEETPVSAFALFVEGVPVATAAEAQTLQAALDERLSSYLLTLAGEEVLYADFYSAVRIGETETLASEFSEEEALREAVSGVQCVAAVLRKESYEIPYQTCRIYERRTTEDHLLREGKNGVGVISNEAVIVDGELTELLFLSDETEEEPVNEEILTGTEPEESEQTVKSTLFSKPYDGRLSSTYGDTRQRSRAHLGIDIIAFAGFQCYREPALAAADGVVVMAGRYGTYGNFVLIDHGNGLQTAYGHFDSVLVEAGQVVTAGTPIGKIGQTGQATGPHLHFEVRVDGRKINPLLFLDYSSR